MVVLRLSMGLLHFSNFSRILHGTVRILVFSVVFICFSQTHSDFLRHVCYHFIYFLMARIGFL